MGGTLTSFADWSGLGIALLLSVCRVGVATALAPAFGARHAPWLARVGIGLALALAVLPATAASLVIAPIPVGTAALVGFVAKELFVGVVLGVGAALVFDFVTEAGAWIDRAGAFGESPGGSRGPVARYLLLLSVLVFVAAGGHRLLVTAFVASYELLPVGVAPGAAALRAGAATFVRASGVALAVALVLALPAVLAWSIVAVALAVAERVTAPVSGRALGRALRPVVMVLALAATSVGLARAAGVLLVDPVVIGVREAMVVLGG